MHVSCGVTAVPGIFKCARVMGVLLTFPWQPVAGLASLAAGFLVYTGLTLAFRRLILPPICRAGPRRGRLITRTDRGIAMAMRHGLALIPLTLGLLCAAPLQAASLSGDIRDLNGKPVPGAMVSVSTVLPGPTATTVFADASGHFAFPASAAFTQDGVKPSVRALGYELLESRTLKVGADALELTVVVKATANQIQSAPASAWLGRVKDHDANASFILDCVGCHQVPGGQFRLYAGTIADIPGADRADIARQSYGALVKYMNFISAEEFTRGPNPPPLDAHNVYSVGNGERVVKYLAERFPARMGEISGYSWGAPLAVTPKTAIYEYEVPRPNAIREAALLGNPQKLYVADVASNRIFTVDPVTGQTGTLDIPWKDPVGPHSLHRDPDGSLWITPFVVSVISHLDVKTNTFTTFPLKTASGKGVGIHDLGAGANHTLLTDKAGRIWFSDIVNDAVGYLDPKTKKIEIYPAPKLKGREGNGSLYGFVMSPDREHVWYSEVAIGHIGSFNVKTRKFEESIVLPANSGPRRIAINEDGILYAALYGSGQLYAYDTKKHQAIGSFDLPDRASAPYSTTWDPVRKVVWIPTSNADVIYRFNPADRSITALPMPRAGAFLRMVDVDPASGRLVTAYGNIVEQVHGPRMALIIEPGDGAYDGKNKEGAR
jgi:streptogramin lyase